MKKSIINQSDIQNQFNKYDQKFENLNEFQNEIKNALENNKK